MTPLHPAGQRIAFRSLFEQPLYLRLFVNDRAPGDKDTAANFKEADFAGYAAKRLTFKDWTIDGLTATLPRQVFESTDRREAMQNVYGWLLARGDGELVHAEQFPDGPYTVVNEGDEIKVSVTIKGPV